MAKLLLYISGFFFMVIGFFYFIVYTNLFTFGYSFSEYAEFMISHIRNYSLLVGIILLAIALHWKGAKRK